MDKAKIVAVSFQSAGKIFDFNACDLELSIGDKVIVETERGRALASVVVAPREETPDSSHPKLKNVLRIANETDLEMSEKNTGREAEALLFCRKRVHERKMEMKLVRAEYLFDGSKIVFFFTADGRVDFRELVRDLAQHFRTRIEMRQIGVRDEAKMVGGLGVCGRELCCCTFLRSFAPVSVKMAKAQGLALNPSKISGQCGRLLCCLGYEYENYNDLRKNLPKCGKKIALDSGQADVIAVNVLKQSVTVSESGQRREVTLSELEGRDKKEPCCQQKAGAKETSKPRGQTTKSKGETPRKSAEGSQEEKRSNRRGNRRRSGSGRSGDNKERSAQQEQNRSKDRREADSSKAHTEKPKETTAPATTADQQEGTANRPRRRRRRPRNRQKPTTHNDNAKS